LTFRKALSLELKRWSSLMVVGSSPRTGRPLVGTLVWKFGATRGLVMSVDWRIGPDALGKGRLAAEWDDVADEGVRLV
jgi:hypothetical protein